MMNRRLYVVALAIVGLFCVSENVAFGQMFGARQVGNPLSRQVGPQTRPAASAADPTGASAAFVQGNERFVRGARAGNQFVGADAGEVSNFVGQVNAGSQTANLQPAITVSARPNLAPMINRPMKKRSANSLLEPRLQIAFEPGPETTAGRVEKAQNAIEVVLSSHFGNQISVSVANQTATLRGVVPDAESVRLAELMTLMEPGISQVENQLQAGSR
jgi:hypothetical protein